MRNVLPLLGCAIAVGSAAMAQTPLITTNGVVNAASSSHSAVAAPGSLISIFGSGLASGLTIASSATLSTSLADVNSVTINGQPAPLAFVSDSQINAQIPWEAQTGMANVVVTRAGTASQPISLQVNQFAPALFGLNLGTLQALATNADGTLTGAAGTTAGINSHPATAGDTITFFATGLGPVNSTPADGANSSDQMRSTTTAPTVLIGGAPAQVSFCGLSPQFVGVYQLNVVVPGGVTTGNTVSVQVQMGGVSSVDPVTIALQ